MDYTQLLIAQYLKNKGLDQTLAAFLKETDCSYSDLQKQEEYGEQLSLESIVKDRVRFDQARKTAVQKPSLKFNSWNHGCRFDVVKLPLVDSMVICAKFIKAKEGHEFLIVSTADKKSYIIIVGNKLETIDKWQVIEHTSVCKFCGVLNSTDICYFITINGALKLYDLSVTREIGSFALNTRIISHFKLLNPSDEHNDFYFIYAGLDNKLRVGILNIDSSITPKFEIITETKLLSKITSLEAMIDTNNKKPIILATRFDYTSILVFNLAGGKKLKHSFNIALNDAQFLSHSFSALDMKLVPTLDDMRTQTLLIATSHIPYMRLLAVNINDIGDRIEHEFDEIRTYYDKILENIVTTIPQDAYSQPIIAISENLGGVLIGSNEGLYVVDLSKRDSWKFEIGNEQRGNRVKTVDVDNNGSIIIGTVEKELFLCVKK